MTGPLEMLVALVLGIDAVVIAGVAISRWRSRRTAEPWPSAPSIDHEPPGAVAPGATRVGLEPSEPSEPAEPSAITQPAQPPEWIESTVLDRAMTGPGSREETGTPDGWHAWVDPVTMAAEATAAWRRALRRDLLRAGSHRRAGALVHIELDDPGSAPGDTARLEAVLLDAIGTVVRPTDHFDHTGPGRFHVLLWDASVAGARVVVQRLEAAFRHATSATRLVVGVEAFGSEDEIAAAVQRAAEQVADVRRGAGGGAAG